MLYTHVPDRFNVDPPPDGNPRPPSRYTLPKGAVDSHAHVIGTHYIAERTYTPHPAPPSAYLDMLDATGMTYGVLVQVSVHGTDNTLMLDTLRAHPQRLRGIAVAPLTLPTPAWQRMKEAGVVGLRLNTTTGGGIGLRDLASYEALCRELGWHLQFLIFPEQLNELAPKLSTLKVPVVFDHLAYVTPAPEHRLHAELLTQLLRDGAWVKLSGAYRISRQAPYVDTVALARQLVQAAPTRCVWGSDWPHVAFRGTMPNPGDLLDLLADWVPNEAQRNAVLADNPQRLYGFA